MAVRAALLRQAVVLRRQHARARRQQQFEQQTRAFGSALLVQAFCRPRCAFQRV